jgi:translation initiation factor RLI1
MIFSMILVCIHLADERKTLILTIAELRQVLDRDVDKLSGGELQRFAIGTVCITKADV